MFHLGATQSDILLCCDTSNGIEIIVGVFGKTNKCQSITFRQNLLHSVFQLFEWQYRNCWPHGRLFCTNSHRFINIRRCWDLMMQKKEEATTQWWRLAATTVFSLLIWYDMILFSLATVYPNTDCVSTSTDVQFPNWISYFPTKLSDFAHRTWRNPSVHIFSISLITLAQIKLLFFH